MLAASSSNPPELKRPRRRKQPRALTATLPRAAAFPYRVPTAMTPLNLRQPIVFHPIFQERIWGGRLLEKLYGKQLPAGAQIGESWEIVDRPEAQSLVAEGPLREWPLHRLWTDHREEVFGEITAAERFPILVKMLDARERLSLQVHPPSTIAAELGGESKTEFWYIADADPAAELFVGLKAGGSREKIEAALRRGDVEREVHHLPVRAGDAMFLPSGRMHAIGAGSVIIEIQENSDTTYRVFDWNRFDHNGVPRRLHLEESLRSIDFDDHAPALVEPEGESLVRYPLFHVEKWSLTHPRRAAPSGAFAIVACLSGALSCAGLILHPGGFFLVPAHLDDCTLTPRADQTTLLRVHIPLA